MNTPNLEELQKAPTLKVRQRLKHRNQTGPDQLTPLRDAIQAVYLGDPFHIEVILISLLCGGHCLLEGPPGYGKSTLIRALADATTMESRTVLTRGDLVGAQLLICEELDLAGTNFRRDLMTAMQEGEAIHHGERIYLDRPFMVMATVNPIEGLSRLRLAERERFLFCLKVPPPTREQEQKILRLHREPQEIVSEPTLGATEILGLQRATEVHPVTDKLESALLDMLAGSRETSDEPLSTRTGICLMRAAQAHAFLHQQPKADLQNLEAIQELVLNHRQLGHVS